MWAVRVEYPPSGYPPSKVRRIIVCCPTVCVYDLPSGSTVMYDPSVGDTATGAFNQLLRGHLVLLIAPLTVLLLFLCKLNGEVRIGAVSLEALAQGASLASAHQVRRRRGHHRGAAAAPRRRARGRGAAPPLLQWRAQLRRCGEVALAGPADRPPAPQHLAAVPAVGGAGLGALLRAGAKPPKLPSFGRGVQPAAVLCFLGPLWPIAQYIRM
jgi:hypothetical protein